MKKVCMFVAVVILVTSPSFAQIQIQEKTPHLLIIPSVGISSVMGESRDDFDLGSALGVSIFHLVDQDDNATSVWLGGTFGYSKNQVSLETYFVSGYVRWIDALTEIRTIYAVDDSTSLFFGMGTGVTFGKGGVDLFGREVFDLNVTKWIVNLNGGVMFKIQEHIQIEIRPDYRLIFKAEDRFAINVGVVFQ